MAERAYLRYTELIGRQVLDPDDRRIGVLFDLVVERRGSEAVVRTLLVSGGSHWSPLDAVRRLRELEAIPAQDLIAIEDGVLRVRRRAGPSAGGRGSGDTGDGSTAAGDGSHG